MRVGNGDYEDITFTNLVNFANGSFTTPVNGYTVTATTLWDIMVISAIDILFDDEARVLINYKNL